MGIKNKFKIICPSYNNENWVDTHISSILEQTYDNYEVLYIDDCSTDKTWDKVNKLVGSNPKFKLVRNEENKGATHNYVNFLDEFMSDDEEILVHLDGDDWFAIPNVLEELNNFYNKNDYWMTYGGFVEWKGGETTNQPFPQNSPYDSFVHRHNKYREDLWRASHLRTYKWFLFKSIDKNDFVSNIDNKLYWHASDLCWAYPCLEMCPEDKIGVVDFVTHVYNASEQNQVRTQEREHQDNSIFEFEIRNKKKYKTTSDKEKLSGEKLPQVNLFGNKLEYNNIPTKFSFCYNQTDGDFDLVFLGDEAIVDYLEGRIQIKKDVPIIARPFEDRNYWINKWGEPKIFNLLLQHYDKFDLILTLDKILLDKLPNSKFWPANYVSQFNCLPNNENIPPKKSVHWDSFEIPEKDTFKIHKKDKLVSCVASNKSFLPGHHTRLDFVNSIRNNHKVDLFGRGINPVDSKFDALKDYAFSVAIEMIKVGDMYHADKQIWTEKEPLWSEKINDCFLTGTVPIYYGCDAIGDFFNTDGILIFDTKEELQDIIDNLSMEKYQSMLPAIKDNLERAKKYPLNNDDLYDHFFKDLIK